MSFLGSRAHIEALRKDSLRRVCAYDDFVYELFPGIHVRALTVRDYVKLSIQDSIFMFELPSKEHRQQFIKMDEATQFVWMLHKNNKDGKTYGKAFEEFIRIFRELEIEHVQETVWDYFQESVADWYGISVANAREGMAKEPYASSISHLIFMIASGMHWSRESILSLSLMEAGQYFRHICVQQNPHVDYSFHNYYRGKAASAYLIEKNAS